jgi:hypothetical protein
MMVMMIAENRKLGYFKGITGNFLADSSLYSWLIFLLFFPVLLAFDNHQRQGYRNGEMSFLTPKDHINLMSG